MNDQLKKAIEVLTEGGIVIFPTDTAFGIGCRMDKEESVKRLFEIRKRPEFQAPPVLFDSLEVAQRYLLPIKKDVKEKLMKPYWPGALTIVLPCQTEKIHPLVRGNGQTLGVRIPNNEAIRLIIKEVGVGILGPSANFHGEETPYSFTDLNPELMKKVDFVLNGECLTKGVSTVIDCSIEPWKILRQGVVKLNL